MDNKTNKPEITSQLDKLISLLERQLDCVRKSELGSFEKITSQAESLIESIHKDRGKVQGLEHKKKIAKIQKLYNTIILSLRSQTQELSDRLKHVRKGRETLSKYQSFTEKSA